MKGFSRCSEWRKWKKKFKTRSTKKANVTASQVPCSKLENSKQGNREFYFIQMFVVISESWIQAYKLSFSFSTWQADMQSAA